MACPAPFDSPCSAAPDTCKRVNYALGMLVGVSDLVQDQLYAGSRRRELAREVLGYGTVHGLAVSIEPDGNRGPRVRVTPGMAWLPSGTPVCVEGDQYVNLNGWLLANAAAVKAGQSGSPPTFSAYLVLSHAQCLTDPLPIPGEPCRNDDELMAPSRIADSFRLDLRATPPAQREEDALRDFVEWLLGTELAASSPPLDEACFVAALRTAARHWLAPATPAPSRPADYMEGSVPAGVDEALFRTALRLWATELRPLWMARPDCSCNATPLPPLDDAVLLARLELVLVSTTQGWQVSDVASEPVTLDESRRPLLLTLRMVQELLLRQRDEPGGEPGAEPGNSVVAETRFGLPSAPGSSLAYARADHSHGSPTLPALGGDISGPLGNVRLDSLQGVPLTSSTPAEGQVLTFSAGRWLPRALPATQPPVIPPLAGDLTGAVGGNRLAALQGVPLNAPNPAANQILRFVGGSWTATDLPAPADQFIGRGTAAPYQIVAAGEARVALVNSQGQVKMNPPGGGYGDLRATQVIVQGSQVRITFTAAVKEAARLPHYIIKLTPIWQDATKFGFAAYLLERVKADGSSKIVFSVLLRAEQPVAQGEFQFAFQVEVSRFADKSPP